MIPPDAERGGKHFAFLRAQEHPDAEQSKHTDCDVAADKLSALHPRICLRMSLFISQSLGPDHAE